MPPRRSNSPRAASPPRRGKAPPSRDEKTDSGAPPEADADERSGGAADAEWDAPPGKVSGERPQYDTGAHYEAAEPPADDEPPAEGDDFLGDEALPASFSKDRDIYGEDDVLPDDEEFAPVDPLPAGDRTQARAQPMGRRTGETRVAPMGEGELPDGLPPESPDATRAGPPLKLEVTAGPDQGKVRSFRGVRMVIGRTAGCDWKLSDPSASRRHCEIVVGDSGVLLRDLNSGNGTKVNGQKVTEKLLEHGDEIAVGKTVLRFIDEVAAFRKAREDAEKAAQAPPEGEGAGEGGAAASDEPQGEGSDGEGEGDGEGQAADGAEGEAGESGADGEEGESTNTQKRDPQRAQVTARTGMPMFNARRKPEGLAVLWTSLSGVQQKAILGGLLLLLLLVLGGVLLATRTEPPPPPDPKLARAAQKLEKAKALVREERYTEAAALAEEAEKLVPGTDVDGIAAGARQEALAQQRLQAAQKLLEEQRFDDAKMELSRASFASPKGVEAKGKLADEIDRQLQQWLIGQADAALQSKDVEAARGIVGRMNNLAQLAYAEKIKTVEEQLQAEAVEAERKGKKQQVERKKVAVAQRREYVERALDAVARKFAAGEFQRAALECDRVADRHRGDEFIRARAQELKRLIPQFARSFEDGQKKYKAGALESAARPLKRARELYQQIGFEGSLGKVIDEELASAALAAAVSSYAREDYPSAAQYYRDALKLAPGDERARSGVAKVNKRAEELYLQAYMIRDREPKEAISKLRIVVQVAEGGNLHQKAKDLLASLE